MKIIDEAISILKDVGHNEDSYLQKKLNVLIKGKKLHESINSIKRYRNDTTSEIKRCRNIKFQQYLFLIEFWGEVRDLIGENWKVDEKKSIVQYRINSTTKLYNKSIQICLDELALFEKGGLLSTLILWRTLYENYVLILFLLKSEERISKQFNEHTEYEKNNILGQNISDDKPKFNQYEWTYVDDGRKFNSFSDIRKFVEESDYVQWYKLTSQLLHPSSFSVNNPIIRERGVANTDFIGVYKEGLELPFNLTITIMEEKTEALIDFFLAGDLKKVMLLVNKMLHESIMFTNEKKSE